MTASNDVNRGRRTVDVHRHDRRASAGQRSAQPCADPACAARHDGDLPLQLTAHPSSPYSLPAEYGTPAARRSRRGYIVRTGVSWIASPRHLRSVG